MFESIVAFIFFGGVIQSEAVFQAERGISRGAYRSYAPDPSARR